MPPYPKRRFRALLLAGLALVAPARAALGSGPDPGKKITQYVHQAWLEDDGLPATEIPALLRTRDGYLWVATSGGLARFDGLWFATYNMATTPAFKTDQLTALAEGHDGSVWIGTRGGGLLRHHRRRFTSYAVGEAAASQEITSLAVDPDGILWVGTGHGLFRFEAERLVAVEEPAALAGLAIRTLHRDDDGTLWIGSRHDGLYRRQDGRPDRVEAVAASSITALYRDRAKDLWIATGDGRLWRLHAGRATELDFRGHRGGRIDVLHEDSAGSLWVGTNTGLYRLHGGQVESLTEANGLTDDRVRALHEDREGNLWIGTYRGLNRLRDGMITTWSTAEGLSAGHVRAVCEDREGNLWIGTWGGGLNRLRDGEITRYTPAAGFPSPVVWSIHQARDGSLWFGTNDGLVHSRDLASFEVFTTADGLASDTIRAVVEDRVEDATLWLGTYDRGVNRFAAGEVTVFDTRHGLSDDRVRWLHAASSGDLWIGTEAGLNRLRDGEITVHTTADGLGSNLLASYYEDPAGTLWLGTRGGGLTRLRDGRFTAYTSREGLPWNDVWWIVEDERENLWLTSDAGLARIRKHDLTAWDEGRPEAIPAVTYGLAEGMRTVECNAGGQPAGWKDKDGRLWFPTMDGVVRVDPRPPPPPPPVIIESIMADDVEVDPGAELRLPPGRGDLVVAFAALDFVAPETVRLRYLLAGYDADWRDAGTRRQAFYTNLPPGSYRFRVVAGRHEVWSDEEAAVALTLAAHFYQTRWFQAAVAVLAVLAGYGGYRLRCRMIRSRNLRLESEIPQHREAEERWTGALAELSARTTELERFVHTVSHHPRSPLLVIQGLLGRLRDAAGGDPEPLAAVGQRIRSATRVTQRVLNQLSQSGRLVQPPQEVGLAQLAREVVEELAPAITRGGVRVTIAPDLPVVPGDRERLREVFFNLVENAVRFMGDQPEPAVEIGCRRVGPERICFVRDNGVGIDPRDHAKVFELFACLDAGTEGTGLGLALARRIIELHGGRIWLESEGRPGEGSTFCFTLLENSF